MSAQIGAVQVANSVRSFEALPANVSKFVRTVQVAAAAASATFTLPFQFPGVLTGLRYRWHPVLANLAPSSANYFTINLKRNGILENGYGVDGAGELRDLWVRFRSKDVITLETTMSSPVWVGYNAMAVQLGMASPYFRVEYSGYLYTSDQDAEGI